MAEMKMAEGITNDMRNLRMEKFQQDYELEDEENAAYDMDEEEKIQEEERKQVELTGERTGKPKDGVYKNSMALTSEFLRSIKLVGNLDVSLRNVADLAALYAYVGFSPEMALKLFALSVDESKNDWQDDLVSLMVLFLTRGTNIFKIRAKTSAEAKRSMKVLIDTYKIKNTNTKLGPNDLTLSRLSSAFPFLCGRILETGVITPTVTVTGLYSAYCWTGGASIIPQGQDEETRAQFQLWDQWALRFDKLISPRKLETDQVRMQNIAKYRDISMRSNYISNQEKIDFWNELTRVSN